MRKQLLFTTLALSLLAVPALAQPGEGSRGAKMFEKHDLNGDGVISKDEALKSAEERFTKMDTDGNGEVTQEEAKASHEAMREKMKNFREKRMERKKGEAAE